MRGCLIPLRICTALKHNWLTGMKKTRLIPLRICTALKRIHLVIWLFLRLIPLRICTALKHKRMCTSRPDRLIPLRICTALKPQMFEINDLRITCAISQVVFTHPYTNTKCRNLHPQYVCIHIQELDVRYFPVSVSVYLFLLYSAEINSSLHQKDNSANLPE